MTGYQIILGGDFNKVFNHMLDRSKNTLINFLIQYSDLASNYNSIDALR